MPAGWVAYDRGWTDPGIRQPSWISVARTDGSSGRNVTRRPGSLEQRADHSPSLSVSGRLAFVRSLRRSSELLVAEPPNWKLRRVSRDSGLSSDGAYTERDEPAWSPDEQYIAWPASDLVVVDVQRRTRLKVAGASCAPRWSPDGETLLYLAGDCEAAGPQHQRVEAVRVSGGARRVIARGSFNSADWSPDGLRVAYAGECESGPGGDPWCHVLVSNADGSRLRRLPNPSGWLVSWVRWTDVATIVAGVYRVDRRVGLVKFNVDRGTGPVPLAPGVIHGWPTGPFVTADGSIAVVDAFHPRAARPALINVGSGAVKWGKVPTGWSGASAIAVS